jgi:hypothetical protein
MAAPLTNSLRDILFCSFSSELMVVSPFFGELSELSPFRSSGLVFSVLLSSFCFSWLHDLAKPVQVFRAHRLGPIWAAAGY